MQNLTLTLVAFVVGGVVTSYLTVNTIVSDKTSETAANLPYFLLAFVVSLALFFFREPASQLKNLAEVPWWALLTGATAAVALFLTTKIIGELGPDKFFVASVAGQLVASVALAHFAILGAEQDDVTWQKVIGILLAIAGAALVSLNFGGEAGS